MEEHRSKVPGGGNSPAAQMGRLHSISDAGGVLARAAQPIARPVSIYERAKPHVENRKGFPLRFLKVSLAISEGRWRFCCTQDETPGSGQRGILKQ
jgi:hypothetical protein